MTRKHFRAVAKILNETDMPPGVKNELVIKFTEFFRGNNDRFDQGTFRAACLAPDETDDDTQVPLL